MPRGPAKRTRPCPPPLMALRSPLVLPSASTVLVRVSSATDRETVVRAVRDRATVHFCASAREVVTRLQQGGVAGVVLEVAGGAGRELPPIVDALGGTAVPLLLRITLDSAAIRHAVAHHSKVNVTARLAHRHRAAGERHRRDSLAVVTGTSTSRDSCGSDAVAVRAGGPDRHRLGRGG